MDATAMQRSAGDAFLKRLRQPEEIAETVMFPLSERASVPTVHTYVFDESKFQSDFNRLVRRPTTRRFVGLDP